MALSIDEFIAKWAASAAAERAHKDMFLMELCSVLDIEGPGLASGDPKRDKYVFERAVRYAGAEQEVNGFIDLYKEGCFVLEAKQGSDKGARKLGTARRGTPGWTFAMRSAMSQAWDYARGLESPPPFLIVTDIGHCFDLYATFDGGLDYKPFPTAGTSRLYLRDLASHAHTLRAIFQDPKSLDPSRHAAKVTREVAGFIADLAKQLERKHDPELIASFLMRCLFTMFAEDVGLLPEHAFTKALREHWIPNPKSFPGGVESLWQTMNTGGDYIFGKILKFNGGLFANPTALPLDEDGLQVLADAAKCTWADVEPAIFGTLLERALDPKERHSLGAHFTPRAYVERLVRPTIEEPLREDWASAQAEAHALLTAAESAKDEKERAKKTKEAAGAIRAFHRKLIETRVLDPACGTGNFLYVSYEVFKRIEQEVLELLGTFGDSQELLNMDRIRVTPAQFLGIEIKPWAKEIAELVLWIGHLQWHLRVYGKQRPVPEPVLENLHNIECRDAVLAYDGDPVPLLDDNGRPVTRWDGETTKTSPVTEAEVPDEKATVQVFRYVNPRKAEWPKADFIVGNPPFIGNKRMRDALGDGYVEALREAWSDVPETADFVMYWWDVAARACRSGSVRRFGLITTNSVAQVHQRQVLTTHMTGRPIPLSVVYAVPDHPWADSATGAAVRIAMTVGQRGTLPGVLDVVIGEMERDSDAIDVSISRSIGRINADLSTGADASAATQLAANSGLSFMGVTLVGHGFRLEAGDLGRLGLNPRDLPPVVRTYRSGKELTQTANERWVIDLFGLGEAEVRAQYPELYQWLAERVLPERKHNKRQSYREKWWVFGEPRQAMRRGLAGLRRYVATLETSKHRVFQFLPGDTLPDHSLFAIAVDDAKVLAVLSARPHLVWSVAAGSTLEDRPRWRNNTCFDPFPFPDTTDVHWQRIRELGEALDAHRKTRQAAHPDLTITGIYNVLEKLRSGEVLTKKEQVIHDQGLVLVLQKIHDDLDAAVFDAYGWPHDLTDEQILERLVALNAERAAEEARGLVRYLRPEFQNPTGASLKSNQTTIAETDDADDEPEQKPKSKRASKAKAAKGPSWPKKLPDQIAAVRDLLKSSASEWTVETLTAHFTKANPEAVETALDSLTALGLASAYPNAGNRTYRATHSTSTRPPPRA